VISDRELIQGLEYLRDTMINVATGGHRIANVNDQFQQTYATVAAALVKRRIFSATFHGRSPLFMARFSEAWYLDVREFLDSSKRPLIRGPICVA
jgi:hypothetical protein